MILNISRITPSYISALESLCDDLCAVGDTAAMYAIEVRACAVMDIAQFGHEDGHCSYSTADATHDCAMWTESYVFERRLGCQARLAGRIADAVRHESQAEREARAIAA